MMRRLEFSATNFIKRFMNSLTPGPMLLALCWKASNMQNYLIGIMNQNSTYIALTNAALARYFFAHQRPNPLYNPNDPSMGPAFTIPISLTQYPKEQVQEFLLYHIVKGAYTW